MGLRFSLSMLQVGSTNFVPDAGWDFGPRDQPHNVEKDAVALMLDFRRRDEHCFVDLLIGLSSNAAQTMFNISLGFNRIESSVHSFILSLASL